MTLHSGWRTVTASASLMQDCYCQCQSVAQTDSDWSSLLSVNESYLMMTTIILHSVHSVYFVFSLFDWLELMPSITLNLATGCLLFIMLRCAVPKQEIGSSSSGIQWHSLEWWINAWHEIIAGSWLTGPSEILNDQIRIIACKDSKFQY